MSLGLLRVHLRLARPGLGMAVALAAAFLPVLIWPERLAGHPLHPHTVLRLVEEFLVLTALAVTVPLWADVEGRRPALWRALPFRRTPVVLGRLALPVATFLLVAAAMMGLAALGGEGGARMSWPFLLRVLAAATPPAAFLTALAALVAVLVRVPVAGAGAALAWWCLDALTQGDLSGPFYLFAASHGLPGSGVEPVAVLAALAGAGLYPAAFLANRWVLAGMAGGMTLVTALLYGRNERFLDLR